MSAERRVLKVGGSRPRYEVIEGRGPDERTVAECWDRTEASRIAAAPLMLEALKEVLACEKCGEDFGRCLECDRCLAAAIAAAEATE